MQTLKWLVVVAVLAGLCYGAFNAVETRHDMKLRAENAKMKEEVQKIHADWTTTSQNTFQLLSAVYPEQEELLKKVLSTPMTKEAALSLVNEAKKNKEAAKKAPEKAPGKEVKTNG